MKRALVSFITAAATALLLSATVAGAQASTQSGGEEKCGGYCEYCPNNPSEVMGYCPSLPCQSCHFTKPCTSCIHGGGGCSDIVDCPQARFSTNVRTQTELTKLNFNKMTPAQAVQTLQYSAGAVQYLPSRKAVVLMSGCGGVLAIVPVPERLHVALATAGGITYAVGNNARAPFRMTAVTSAKPLTVAAR